MIKRQWPPVLFIIAFVISLAHTSIPHTHPEKSKSNTRDHSHDHSNDVNDKHHHDHSDNHSHSIPENPDETLPVFSHFSNADYVGNPSFHFHAKEKHVLELFEPATLIIEIALVFDRTFLFPKARDLPSGRHLASQSLRAPPFA